MGSLLRISDAVPSALATLLVQATIVLLAALVAHAVAGRSPAARHGLLLGAIVTVGLCPLLALSTAALEITPIIPVTVGSGPFESRAPQDTLPFKVDGPSLMPGEIHRAVAARGPSVVGALSVIWFAGALLAFGRLARGMKITRSIRKGALPVDDRIVEKLLPRLAGDLGRAPPPILISDQIDVPMAVGCLR